MKGTIMFTNRRVIAVIGIVAALILSGLSAQAKEYLSHDAALKLAFPDADTITPHTVTLTKEQTERISKATQGVATAQFVYYTGSAKDVPQGYAMFGDARSKSDPFTYLLVLNPDCSIRMVEIVTYSGIRGHEVRQKGFLNQFKGKTSADKLQLRSDIKNMAGATISCTSLTDSIRRLMAYVAVLLPAEAESDDAAAKSAINESVHPETELIQRAQYLMGTMLEIGVYAADRKVADEAITQAFGEVARLEQIFSTFRPESDASRLNRATVGIPVPVSDEFIALLTYCQVITEQTQGAFDVTAGPLVRLWQDAAKTGVMPTDAEIASARQAVGMQHLTIDREQRTVARSINGVQVDFGGIAKGYALDRAGDILREAGLTGSLLNFGGQYLAVGPPADQPYWRIHVRHPFDPSRSLAEIHLTGGSVSTSGDYERGLLIDGEPFSHIIDPRNGRPAFGMVSTTVFAPTGMEADALSTGLYVLGTTHAQRYAEWHGIAVLLMDKEGTVVKTEAAGASFLLSP